MTREILPAPGAAPDQHMTVSGTRTEPHLRLDAAPREITHLVCCRAPSWRRTLCGAESDTVNVAAETLCTMCVEQIETMWPGWRADPEWFCPVDGRSCPDEHEIDLRIAWESGPPAR
ncbi:hypothetical protein [Streptomyces orinoci]|uniref:Uncharacterized protein n=1 Tax=Streptomyces orinoci TaxID=67339 RepID=A0ABV3K3Q6_STRON|nr:hypothetical protein [Streptomyces orinoci]